MFFHETFARRALGIWLTAGCAAFFAGLLASSVIFFKGRPFDPKAAIISDIQSSYENPRGYAAAAAGTALCGLMLAPAGVVCFARLRPFGRKWSVAGAVVFGVGLAAATAIGVLAPFTQGYTAVHIQLAYAAFTGICAGSLILLRVAAGAARDLSRGWRHLTMGFGALNGAAVLFLLYLYFGPDVLDNRTIWTSLAFCEWMLCADCAVSLWILAALVARIKPAAEKA